MNIDSLKQTATAQRRLIYLVLLNCLGPLALYVWFGVAADFWSRHNRLLVEGVVIFAVVAVTILLVFRLMQAMEERTLWIVTAMILLLVPWVSVLVLLVVNHRATQLLREHRLRVGMLGVSREEVDRLAVALRTSRALQESVGLAPDGAADRKKEPS